MGGSSAGAAASAKPTARSRMPHSSAGFVEAAELALRKVRRLKAFIIA
jgi:hypothetical protein